MAIVDYCITPGGEKVAYLTVEGLLYVLDRKSGETIAIPPFGQLLNLEFNAEYECLRIRDNRSRPCALIMDMFALTPDGRYLIFLAWEDAPESSYDWSGTIFAVDLKAPDSWFELGYCGVRQEQEVWGGCSGMYLSPDGSQVFYIDGKGAWITQIPLGRPNLLIEHPVWEGDYPPCHAWKLVQWSPDNQWLLVWFSCFEMDYLVVADVHTGQAYRLPDTRSFITEYVEVAFGPTGIWVGIGSYDLEKESGALYLAQPPEEESVQVTRQITETRFGFLWPRSLYPLPNGDVGFANRKCVSNPGPESGLFLLRGNSTLAYIAPLPLPSCCQLWKASCWGTVLWSSNATAFLFLDNGNPILLGLTDGTALWDVQALLKGATRFRWGLPAQP